MLARPLQAAPPPNRRITAWLDQAGDRRRGAVLLVALVLTLFGSTAWHATTLDSQHFLGEDVRVREFRLGPLLTQGYWPVDPDDPMGGVGTELYRPLTLVWMSAFWQLCSPEQCAEQRPVLLNLANLGLHAASVVLRFWLFLLLLGDRPRQRAMAWFAALLLAVHPIATETVATQVGAAEGLVAVCGTAALLCWHRWQVHGARGGAIGFAGWLLLALLAKEHAIAIAAIAPLGSRLLLRRRLGQCARVALVAAAPVLLWLSLRLRVTGSAIGGPEPMFGGYGLSRQLQTALAAIGTYDVPALLWPSRLLAFVSHQALPPPAGFADARVLAGLAAICSWLAALVWTLRRDRAAAFGLSFFAIALLPVSNLVVPIGALAATRFLYLPMTGLALAASIGVQRLLAAPRPALRRLAVAVATLLPLGLALATLRELPLWRSQAALMRSMARRMPDLFFEANLGSSLLPEVERAPGEAKAGILRREVLQAFATGLGVPLPQLPGSGLVPEPMLELAWRTRMAQAIAGERWNGDFELAGNAARQMLTLARQGAAQSDAVHGRIRWQALEAETECLLAAIAVHRAQRCKGATRQQLVDEAVPHVVRARNLEPESLGVDEQWLQVVALRGNVAAFRTAYGEAYARARPLVARQAAAARIAIGYARFLDDEGEHEAALAAALEAMVHGGDRFGGAGPYFDYGMRGLRAADAEVRRLARSALEMFLQRAGADDAAKVASARQQLQRAP